MIAHRLVAAALAAVFTTAFATAARQATAAEVGRLFFSPEERVELEKRRFAPAPPPPKPVAVIAAPAPPDAPPGPEYTTVNGHVWRGNGKSTTWVNGVPLHDTVGGRSENVQVRAGAQGPQVALKVGQTYERISGQRSDPLKGGQIRVNPKP